ncbi:MAG: OmpA family protein [Desulfocapsaceae bacterium]|nr:OmpA family protein [Desulfocapsaceae bacterium]
MRKDICLLQIGRKFTGFGCLMLCSLMFSLSGCVSKGAHEAIISERDQIIDERDRLIETRNDLIDKISMLNRELAETEEQKEMVTAKARAAQDELDRQQQLYDNLEATFAKERAANQVKIEMMKSGVKVNLANEILFPSGSAALNDMGVEVLRRAAAELKDSTYQVVVAGFTDDVPISSGLQYRYPTNWELAGARAASVVRLFEEEEISADKLLAISFGENSPVASNETPEGRKLNRRIEIMLRPAPIAMN